MKRYIRWGPEGFKHRTFCPHGDQAHHPCSMQMKANQVSFQPLPHRHTHSSSLRSVDAAQSASLQTTWFCWWPAPLYIASLGKLRGHLKGTFMNNKRHSYHSGNSKVRSSALGNCVSHSVISNSLWLHGLQPSRLLCPRSGCHSLLQGSFPSQGLNLGLLHCRQTL